MIRYKEVRGQELEEAVDTLLNGIAASRRRPPSSSIEYPTRYPSLFETEMERERERLGGLEFTCVC